MSMVGIGLVFLIEDTYGSYGLAGAVAATGVLTLAIAAPFLSRFIDRYGQSTIMRPALILSNIGWVAVLIAAQMRASKILLFAAVIFAGVFAGSMGALVRARWALVAKTPRHLHTAYALESVYDEVVFVIGPVLATTLATALFPAAAIIAAMVFALGGGLWFLAQKNSEPPPAFISQRRKWRRKARELDERKRAQAKLPPKHSDIPDVPVLRIPAIWALLFISIGVGVIFGGSEVPTIAFADELGYQSMAGVVLGIFSFGSLISGLVYGARSWPGSLEVRLAVGVVALAIGSSLFLLAHSLWILSAVMFLTGFAIAPSYTNMNAVIQKVVHPSRLTEGFTWGSTASASGFAIGTSIAGVLVDHAGGHAGYWVAIAGGIFASLCVLVTFPIIRRALQARMVTWPENPPSAP